MQIINETTSSFLTRYYSYVVIGVAAVVFILGGFFLLWPQYTNLQQSGVLEYQAALDTLRSRQQYVQDLKIMEENYTSLDKRLTRLITTVLPPYADSVILFEEIELLLTDAGLDVQSINIASAAETGLTLAETIKEDVDPISDNEIDITPAANSIANNNIVQEVTVTVNVVGEDSGYANFKQFLYELESYEHLIELQSISYAPASEGTTLVFKTYQRTAPANE